ncbi:MAG: DNA polymerase III subunit delta [Clostridiales bacterium]|nr:DNA polymerase III subunit delta [Clostridiales bacterium]
MALQLRDFAGNEGLKRQLAGGLPRSHAWIISGPVGSGRHTLARLMASAFVCRGRGEVPCGLCQDCRKVARGIHPDVAEVARFLNQEDLAKDGDLKIYAVRALRSDAFVRPTEADRKVYIIDRPLSPQDQNALLKLLEDGPAYAVFLLVVENAAALLETVRSRCTELTCAPVTEGEALAWLRTRYPNREDSALRAAAAACGGLLGAAVRRLEDSGQEDALAPWLELWAEALSKKDELALMECSVKLQTGQFQRADLAPFYRRLAQLCHEALTASYTGPAAQPLSQKLAGALSRRQLAALEALAEQGRQDCAFYVSVGHSAGWLAAKAWEILSR